MKEKISKDLDIVSVMRNYATLGFPVIPCNGKTPLIKDWPQRKTSTAEDVEAWVAKWPQLNIGLVLGSASGIVGIDIDGPEAEQKLQEISQGNLSETWAFNTPGRGKRLLYSIPQGFQAKKWTMSLEGEHNELALLGEGNQTIVPPSIHPNGGTYQWVEGYGPDEIALAPAPQWMLDLMGGKAIKKSPLKAGTNDAEQVDEYSPEAVFERLFSHCSKFRNALKKQKEDGLPEELWFKWLKVFVNSGHPLAALGFSKLSGKHDGRSEDRLQQLIDESGAHGPMPRCTSLGCQEEGIESCLFSLHLNEKGEATNSPGAFIRDMEKILPPTDITYAPYVQALEKVPEYDIDESGSLCGYDRKGNPFAIANFVARPVMEVVRDDGTGEDRTFRIEGLLYGGRPLKPVDITATEFFSMNWVLTGWGISATIHAGQGKKDQLRAAIQCMGQDVERLTIFTHLGFRKLPEGRWVYLHAAGCLGADGVVVETDKALNRYRLPDRIRDPVAAVKASLKFLELAPHRVMIPLLALVYLSPLTEAFRQCGMEPNFVVWLYGGTGTRKTSLSLALLSHFGDFATKTPPASFKDTANAIEKHAFDTKDTLLLIDDYHPESSKSAADKMAQTAQRILRMYGDRVARGRLKSTLEFQKSFTPRGMALVTGEDLPQGQSSVARFFGVELLKDDVALKVLTWAQENAKLLSEAMTGYIRWLLPQMDQLPQVFANEFQEARGIFQSETVHGRIGEAAAWLLIAYDLMLTYFIETGAIDQKEGESMFEEGQTVLKSLVHRQGALVRDEKPADIFLRSLNELLTSGKVRVNSLKASTTDDLFQTGSFIGWQDSTYYYLLPEATYNAVSRFLSARGQRLPVLERTLWKNLDESGAIYTETSSDGRVQRCPKKTIPKREGQKEPERPRLLHLKKSALEVSDDV